MTLTRPALLTCVFLFGALCLLACFICAMERLPCPGRRRGPGRGAGYYGAVAPGEPEEDALEVPPEAAEGKARVGVDALADGAPLPAPGAFQNEPDEFVEAIYDSNEAMGEVLQQEIEKAGVPSRGELAAVAQRVEDAAVAAATPAPPSFEPLALDVLPQKYWQPVFPGCQPVFTDKRCDYSYPEPRLWVTDLDDLQYARSLEQGRVNMIEPLEARQAMAQLLSIGVRTRRDVYTQASPANDIAAQSTCAQLKSRSPAYVWL